MTVLSIFSILAALTGGVVAVFVGQILTLYREDIESARHARYQIDYTQLLSEDKLSVNEIERTSNKMKQNIEDVAREDMWLFSDDGKIALLELIHALSKLEYAASEGDTDNMDAHIDTISKMCDRLDGEIAYVNFSGALKRYFGDERPYSDYSDS